jgi:hypothetical protein
MADAVADSCGSHCASACGRASIAASRWKPAACNVASRVSASSYNAVRSLASANCVAKAIAINARE